VRAVPAGCGARDLRLTVAAADAVRDTPPHPGHMDPPIDVALVAMTSSGTVTPAG
jgi:hypothetical protein